MASNFSLNFHENSRKFIFKNENQDFWFWGETGLSKWKKTVQRLNGGVVIHAAGSGRSCARRGVKRNVQAADDRCSRIEMMTPPKEKITLKKTNLRQSAALKAGSLRAGQKAK